MPASNCIDIGAHRGEFLRQFNDLAPAGRHTAIEPIPALAAMLRRTYPTTTVIECALGSASRTATFYHVINDPGWSGLRTQVSFTDRSVEEITVQVRPLDSLIAEPAAVDFIKLDVEGAELEVLSGATNILSCGRPAILFEHAIVHAAAYDSTPSQVHDAFAAADYEVKSLTDSATLTREVFTTLCHRADATCYDRNAQTNWLATPRG